LLNRSLPAVFTLIGMAAALTTLPASAQNSIAGSLYGTFTAATIGNQTQQNTADQAGALVEFRHIASPLVGFEFAYSWNRANETYLTYPQSSGPSGLAAYSSESVSANAHEFTGDWIPSVPFRHMRFFGVLGVGVHLDVPSSSQATVVATFPCGLTVIPGGPACPGPPVTTVSTSSTSSSEIPVYVYGAGVDWALFPRIGIRLQYRGNVYPAVNLDRANFAPPNSYTHTAEPMIGFYFKL
jgi:opacity protein-like surface antigen